MNTKPSLHNKDLLVHLVIRISPSSCIKPQQNRWSSTLEGVRERHCFSPLHEINLNWSTASGSRSDKELDKAWRGSQLSFSRGQTNACEGFLGPACEVPLQVAPRRWLWLAAGSVCVPRTVASQGRVAGAASGSPRQEPPARGAAAAPLSPSAGGCA